VTILSGVRPRDGQSEPFNRALFDRIHALLIADLLELIETAGQDVSAAHPFSNAISQDGNDQEQGKNGYDPPHGLAGDTFPIAKGVQNGLESFDFQREQHPNHPLRGST